MYRRADLHSDEDDRSLIEDLYVDPLPGREVLENLLRPHTVFLVGRKGTGKSTIFQRAQHEIRSKSTSTSAYVDIKTVYEQSEIDAPLLDKLNQTDLALPKEAVGRFLLYKAFLLAVIDGVREELRQKIQTTFWARLKAKLFSSVDQVLERLDEVIHKAKHTDFADVTGLLVQAVNSQKTAQKDIKLDGTTSATLAAVPSATATISASQHESLASSDAQAFTQVLIRILNVKGILTEVSTTLGQLKIRHLHIFIDDFSELPAGAMRIVVDSLLAPLNNWSNELIKFKIAAYPGRLYLGDIARTKIAEISLDMYSLYGRPDVASMEEKATDFLRRLVQARIAHFCGCEFEDFCRTRSPSEDEDTLWRRLFYATMANPRNLGYILHFLYADVLIHGEEISLSSINKAAQRYFDEKIEPFFAMSRFTHLSFHERSSVYSLKALLERFVSRARVTQREMQSEIM